MQDRNENGSTGCPPIQRAPASITNHAGVHDEKDCPHPRLRRRDDRDVPRLCRSRRRPRLRPGLRGRHGRDLPGRQGPRHGHARRPGPRPGRRPQSDDARGARRAPCADEEPDEPRRNATSTWPRTTQRWRSVRRKRASRCPSRAATPASGCRPAAASADRFAGHPPPSSGPPPGRVASRGAPRFSSLARSISTARCPACAGTGSRRARWRARSRRRRCARSRGRSPRAARCRSGAGRGTSRSASRSRPDAAMRASSTSSRSSRWLPPMISPMPGASTSIAATVRPSSFRRM